MKEIDIAKIFRETWGFVGLPFPEIIVRGAATRKNQQAAAEIFEEMVSVSEKKSVSEKGASYRYPNGNGIDAFMPIWLSEIDNSAIEYLLPNTVSSMSSQLRIVTTQLVNRDGSVKEQTGMDEWKIRVRGVLVGTGDDYPEAETQLLVDWYKKKKSLYIQNVRTAICLEQREKVIITNLELRELRGFENTQPYELELVSDIDFSLYVE
jgi:hypothetical protein